jgi:hypothetical protein
MDIALKILEITAGLAAFGWFIWWRLQRSEAGTGVTITKMLVTGVLVYALVTHVAPLALSGFGALVGVPLLAAILLMLSIMWRHEVLGVLTDPLGDMIDGGKEEIKPQPFYTHAEAKQMAGDIPGAIAAVREQLEKFPADFDGRMRLATLLAEHSEDLPGALAVIEDALLLPGIEPGQASYALNTTADWHLKFGRDSESARLAIERITTLFPGTQAALRAEQRLSNHASQEMLAHEDDNRPIAIPEFDRKLGLKRRKFVAPEKMDINAEESRLRARLAKNANDWTAREELARLYVEQFEFYERGLQELEILITKPGQPQREVVRWLQQRADWQVRLLNDVEAGRATLKRIQTLYPKSAAAEGAAMAILYLQPVSKFEKKKAEE